MQLCVCTEKSIHAMCVYGYAPCVPMQGVWEVPPPQLTAPAWADGGHGPVMTMGCSILSSASLAPLLQQGTWGLNPLTLGN